MNFKKIFSIVLVLLIAAALLCSCAAKSSASESTESLFTDRDINYSYDGKSTQEISLNDESITISDEGIYILSGNISDGQIIVDADDSDKIQIVLNGVEINSNSGAAIYIKNANKVFITTASGSENLLKCGGEMQADGDNNIDGVIFSKSDLTLNGAGTLSVETNYSNGIVSKDDLKLTSGTYSINSSGNALEANDIIAIANGNYNLNSQNDALHSDNDITVVDGTININAEDDAFHADNILTVSGGKIDVKKAHEGLEGKEIYISGGDISVITDDDGVNAAGGNDSSGIQNGGFKDEFSSQDGVLISISGGKLYVNCEGDGLDSNGDLEITGGEIIVEGPQNSGNGSLDYNGNASIKNATILAIGSGGMAMNFSEAAQGSALVNFGASYSGEKITVSDSEGNEIYSFNSTKTISSVLFSAASLEKGKTYTISIGDEYQTITLDDYIYGSSNGFGMGHMR